MKIKDIKPFVSTDRKVHVALTSGGSKDGLLSVVQMADTDGMKRTFVQIKGERGRPSTLSPAIIDSITWHTDPTKAAAETVEKVRKSNPTKSEEVQPVRKGNTDNPLLHCVDCGAKGVTLTVVKDGAKKHLFCADCKRSHAAGAPKTKPSDTDWHKPGRKQGDDEPVGVISLTGPRTATAGKFQITLNDDGTVTVTVR